MISWIAYALALSALAGAAALAAEAVLRMYRLPTRWAWVAALVVSCAGPFALAALPGAPARAQAAVAVGEPEVAVFRAAPDAPAPSLRERAEGAVPALWAAASLLALLAVAMGAAVLRRRRRAWRAGRVAGVPVLVSATVGPAVVGFVRPVIVVPRWTLVWGEAMQRMVVRHEGEHIRARDPLLVLAATLAAALVPWNLAAWWQLRRLRLAVEVDCDTRTLRGGGDVAAYGELLLRVGALGTGTRVPLAAFAEPRSLLERRIRAMTARTPRNRAALAAGCGALLLAVAGAAYALPAAARPAALAEVPLRVSAFFRPAADTVPTVPAAPPTVNAGALQGPIKISFPDVPAPDVDTRKEVSFVVHTDGATRDIRVLTPAEPRTVEFIRDMLSRQRFTPSERALPLRVQVQVQNLGPGNGIATTTVTTVVDTVVMTSGPARDTTPAMDISQAEARPQMVNAAEVARAIERSYPPRLREAGVRGDVTLELVVERDGSPRGARVIDASHPEFGEAALWVSSRMRFRPARRGSRPVAVRLQLPVTFRSVAW